MTKLSKSVAEEIQSSIDIYSRWSRIYEWSAPGVIILSVSLSFVAGVNAAHGFITNIVCSATIAGLPALLLSIERTLKFRGRSEWFWNMLIEYQALQRALERNEIDDSEASRRISEIEETG